MGLTYSDRQIGQGAPGIWLSLSIPLTPHPSNVLELQAYVTAPCFLTVVLGY